MATIDDRRPSEERFRNLFEYAPIAVWEEDFTAVVAWFDSLRTAGVTNLRAHLAARPEDALVSLKLVRIRDLNQEAVLQNGAKSKEELLRQMPDLFTDETVSVWVEELSQLWDGARRIQLETTARRLDGATAAMLMRIQVPGPPDRPNWESVIVTGTDISDQKQMEWELRDRKDRLAEMMKLSALRAAVGMALNRDAPLPDILSDCCDAILRHVGAAFARVWTLNEADQILQLRASRGLYTHLDGPHARIPVGSYKIGRIAEMRMPIITNQVAGDPQVSDQEWVLREGMVAFAGHPLICEDRLIGVLALFARHPLTPSTLDAIQVVADAVALGVVRLQAEAALRVGEARLRAVVKSAMDCIISIDRHGRVVEFNPAAERTFGYTRDEALGQDLGTLIIPAVHQDGHKAGLARYLQTRESRILGKRLVGLPAIRKNGSSFPTELTVVPLDLGGELVFTAFLRDITEQREAESHRERVEAELREALAEADAANQAKTQFLANMSHEFRTPMAAVVGYAEILLDPRLSADERSATVRAIRRNGDHLLALISDVLDLAKIEAGRLEVERVPCRLWRTVTESLSAAGVQAQEKELGLNALSVGRIPRTITSDPTRFRQILDNLLSNAVKFTGEGKRVEVRVRVLGEPPVLAIDVEDEGMGMAPDVITRLFRPFMQADASTTRRFGGTGLGLSICKKLAESLGGDLAVRSTPGAGTCFTLTLPVDPSDLLDMVDQHGLSTESHLFAPRPLNPAKKMVGRVLLAEDYPDNRNILQYFMERAGLTVDFAENGRVAVERASAREYDVVLMDMQMPELDGYAATRLLRTNGYHRAIIALTANAMVGDKEKCLEAGCNAYLTKPVDSERLLKVIGKFLPSNSGIISAAGLTRQYTPQPGPFPPAVDPVAELIREFRAALPTKAAAMADALRAGDADTVASLAHRLKGSAGMYGLPAVSEAAGLIELAAREHQEASLLEELIAELVALAAAQQY